MLLLVVLRVEYQMYVPVESSWERLVPFVIIDLIVLTVWFETWKYFVISLRDKHFILA